MEEIFSNTQFDEQEQEVETTTATTTTDATSIEDYDDLPPDDAEINSEPPESEESESESEETTEESTDTEETTEGKGENESKSKGKKDTYKPNLPTGFSFNPLVIAIKPFYEKLIAEDEIFADVVKARESRAEKPKSLKECAEYIMGEAYEYARTHKQGNFGMAGFPDEEMFTLIRHYYDEEHIEVRKINGASASVSIPSTNTAKGNAPAKGKEKPKKPSNPKNAGKNNPLLQKVGKGKKTPTQGKDKVYTKEVGDKTFTITEFALF